MRSDLYLSNCNATVIMGNASKHDRSNYCNINESHLDELLNTAPTVKQINVDLNLHL